MKYTLVYTHRAVKDIDKLDKFIKERIGKALLRFSESPLYFCEKLTSHDIGSYRFRVGDYRIIFDIVEKEIVILRVGHRKEIYRR